MEHEVYVPFSVGSVRAALAEPGRVVRCVPGLMLDAEGAAPEAGEPAEGRLRLRIGGSTITYRGSLTVTPHGEEFAVEGSGTEARGDGSVRLDLTVVPRRAREGEGTRLVCTGTVRSDGRLGDIEDATAAAAGRRLLDRFGTALAESIDSDPPRALDAPDAPSVRPAEGTGGIGGPADNERVIPGIPGPETGAQDATDRDATDREAADRDATDREAAELDTTDRDADLAEPSPDAEAGGEAGAGDEGTAAGPEPHPGSGSGSRPESASEAGSDSESEPSEAGGFDGALPPASPDPMAGGDEGEAPAEAAHARRTMIGRSAEEVDHAPPRGRYAPIPVPPPLTASPAFRWAAPAAVAAVAGAVVITRALRRRR